MERRRFIYYLAAATAATTATATAFTACRHRYGALDQPDFLSHLCDAGTLRNIGTAYRKQTPSEAREKKLIGLLGKGPSPETIKNDFTTGNIVIVNGWVLSLTEARQCALYSLTRQ